MSLLQALPAIDRSSGHSDRKSPWRDSRQVRAFRARVSAFDHKDVSGALATFSRAAPPPSIADLQTFFDNFDVRMYRIDAIEVHGDSATVDYENAIVGRRIGKPVEYQDARGFIFEAERMIESVASGLEKKDAAALKEVRTRLAELKKVFPAAVPPRTPIKDHGAMLALVSRIELAASRLM